MSYLTMQSDNFNLNKKSCNRQYILLVNKTMVFIAHDMMVFNKLNNRSMLKCPAIMAGLRATASLINWLKIALILPYFLVAATVVSNQACAFNLWNFFA